MAVGILRIEKGNKKLMSRQQIPKIPNMHTARQLLNMLQTCCAKLQQLILGAGPASVEMGSKSKELAGLLQH